MHMNINRVISQLAPVQLGLVTRAQFVAEGVTGDEIYGAVRRGALRVPERAVYAATTYPESYAQRALAALWSVRTGAAVLSHETALYVLGLLAQPPPRVHLVVPRGTRATLKGAMRHESRRLEPADVLTHGLFRVTSPPRTM